MACLRRWYTLDRVWCAVVIMGVMMMAEECRPANNNHCRKLEGCDYGMGGQKLVGSVFGRVLLPFRVRMGHAQAGEIPMASCSTGTIMLMSSKISKNVPRLKPRLF